MSTLGRQENKLEPIPFSDALAGAASSPDSEFRPNPTGRAGIPAPVYDLRLEHESQEFYACVTAFSSRVIAEAEQHAAVALDGYEHYVTETLRESPRSRGEYALELLTVGMAIRLYGPVAHATPGWVIDLARELFSLRLRSPQAKPTADFLRAGLFQLFMRRKLHVASDPAPAGRASKSLFDALPHLLEWMQATGEFEQESERLDNWRSYLRELPRPEAESWAQTSVQLFDWFTREAELALGTYTAGVMHFLETSYAARFWREDQIFCGRLPVEYHLGMVAAEVMNEGLRADFRRKPAKVLLVPTCMRGEHRDDCMAVVDGLDMTCAGCDPECTVHRITLRMKGVGVPVYLVPHATGFSRWLERWQQDPKVGVAAVACMMNILAGGYEMRARKIASQCVPLDYPGCAKHWTSNGVPTGVNEERLLRIVADQPHNSSAQG